MNKIIETLAGCAAALAMLSGSPADASITFTLAPADGAIHGRPGETVGWGFSLYNDTVNYLVVTSAEFQPVSTLGTFSDFLGPQFLEIAPSATAVQAFDLARELGVGSFAIDQDPSVWPVLGRIQLTYDLYSRSTADPAFDPDTDPVSTSNSVSADASASVPEPATLMLLCIGAIALPRLRRRVR